MLLFHMLTSEVGLWHLFLTYSLQLTDGVKSTHAPNLLSRPGQGRFSVILRADRPVQVAGQARHLPPLSLLTARWW